MPALREKLSSLSEIMREIKVGFARFYNRRYNRYGYFWGDRFNSVILKTVMQYKKLDRIRYFKIQCYNFFDHRFSTIPL